MCDGRCAARQSICSCRLVLQRSRRKAEQGLADGGRRDEAQRLEGAARRRMARLHEHRLGRRQARRGRAVSMGKAAGNSSAPAPAPMPPQPPRRAPPAPIAARSSAHSRRSRSRSSVIVCMCSWPCAAPGRCQACPRPLARARACRSPNTHRMKLHSTTSRPAAHMVSSEGQHGVPRTMSRPGRFAALPCPVCPARTAGAQRRRAPAWPGAPGRAAAPRT